MPVTMAETDASLVSCVPELQKLGFTDYEARAYVTLLQCQPATAYQVSKHSGLPRANVYSALESLSKKGAAQMVTKSPTRYVAADPSALMGYIAKETGRRCRELATSLSEFAITESTEYVWMLHGWNNIITKIDDMIANARRHVWIKAPHKLLRPHLASLHEATEREVDIVVVLFGDPPAAEEFNLGPCAKVYLHEGNGLVVGLGDRLITLATDFEEALTANAFDEECGAYTRNRPIVYQIESLIRHEVYLAEIFERFHREIEAEFGPALFSLRQRYLAPEQVEHLKDLVAQMRTQSSQK